ncbi:MAG: CRISPR-associated ring nuclease, partial [Puniceicoccales bacterium]
MIRHRLVTTLGTTWAVVPEVYGIFTGFYPDHRNTLTGGSVDTVEPPEELWIVTTRSAWQQSSPLLENWANLVGTKLSVFLHPDDDLATGTDVTLMRELIFRVVLHASAGCDELSCSLAGGRKTMSADMQEAARTFGCARLLHVLSNGNVHKDWPDFLKDPPPGVVPGPRRPRGARRR